MTIIKAISNFVMDCADFDNDGNYDSFLQNPIWTYEEPGIYSVHLIVLVNNESISLVKENHIQVFNGHTALEFDGQQSHVLCSAENSMNLQNTFTIETWIYPYSYGPEATFGLGRIFDKSAISIFLNNEFPLFPNQSLVVQMQHADGTLSTSTTPENSILLNDWIHVAVSYDGIDQVKMFVNGLDIMSNQPTFPIGILEDNSDEDIYLGNLSTLNKGFEGIIDEIRIWNYFIDQNEIQEKMNKYLHGNENGLIHYWQMNEGNGDSIFDLAGNSDGEIFDVNWCQGKELEPTGIINTQISSPEFYLSNFPNPFNPSTTIYFELSAKNSKNAKIEIYNLKGQKVKDISPSLCHPEFIEGRGKTAYSVYWNGTDDNDKAVSSGIYFIRLKVINQQISKKMLLMK